MLHKVKFLEEKSNGFSSFGKEKSCYSMVKVLEIWSIFCYLLDFKGRMKSLYFILLCLFKLFECLFFSFIKLYKKLNFQFD